MVPPTQDSSKPESHESQQRLDQVRDLLFGETARGLEDRVVELNSALAEAHAALSERTNAMRKEIDELRERSVDRADLASALRQLADVVDRGAGASAQPKRK